MTKDINNSLEREHAYYNIDLSCLKLSKVAGLPFILSIKPPKVVLPSEYPAFVDVKIAELYIHKRIQELQRLIESQNNLDKPLDFTKSIHYKRIKNLLAFFGVKAEGSAITCSNNIVKSNHNHEGAIHLILKEKGFLDILDKISRIYLNVEGLNPPKFSKKEIVWYFGRLYRVIKNESNGIVTIFSPQYGKKEVHSADLHNSNIERLFVKKSTNKSMSI